MAYPLKLSRAQLARVAGNDVDALRKLEMVLDTVAEIAPHVTEEVAIAAGNAEARAVSAVDSVAHLADMLATVIASPDGAKGQQALDQLGRIASALEYLALAPTRCQGQELMVRLESIGSALEAVALAPVAQDQVGDTGPGSIETVGEDMLFQPKIDHADIVHRSGVESIGDGKTFKRWIALEGQAVNPQSPPAGTTLVHATTTQGFTRLEQDNEAGTNIILGRDSVVIARNVSGGTIYKGQAVYVSGSTGNVPNVALARADSIYTLPAVFVAVDNIANNAFGQVMRNGIISSIDTSAYASGSQIWVSPSVAGGFTSTRPSGSINYVQRVGTVLVSGVGNGSIDISIAPAVLNMETGTNAPVWTGKSVASAAGVITSSTPSFSATQIWASGGVQFVASSVDVTDGGSASTSLVCRYRVDGGEVFTVRKDGLLFASLGASFGYGPSNALVGCVHISSGGGASFVLQTFGVTDGMLRVTGSKQLGLVNANATLTAFTADFSVGTKASVYGATPVYRASSPTATAPAASTDAAVNVTPWGYATQDQADDLVTLANSLKVTLDQVVTALRNFGIHL